LLIQTPEGAGEVTFLMNEVNIQIGSTVYFEAAPGGEMIVSTLEGKARVKAHGVEQMAVAGTRVRVPMNKDLGPAGPPTPPESYNDEALSKLPLGLMPRHIIVHPSALGGLSNNQMFQPVDSFAGSSDPADTTGDDVVGDDTVGDSTLGDETLGDGVLVDDPDKVMPDQFGCGEPGNACNAPGHTDEEEDKEDKDKKDKKDKKEK
jgi:hypothetical protein